MTEPETTVPGTRRVVAGWEGRYLEDFHVGDVYRHSHGRTITETDNTWFTLLTNNTHDIHYNADYASRTEFGKPLVDSTLTLAVVTGLSVEDVSRNAVANLGWEHVRLPAPVFAGDTIYAESEVLEVRPSRFPTPARASSGYAPGASTRMTSRSWSSSASSWSTPGRTAPAPEESGLRTMNQAAG